MVCKAEYGKAAAHLLRCKKQGRRRAKGCRAVPPSHPAATRGAWTCCASPTARRPTCRAAPTCWCTRCVRVGWVGKLRGDALSTSPAAALPQLSPSLPVLTHPPTHLRPTHPPRSLTRAASARGCCTSWRPRRRGCWRPARRWCRARPASGASPSSCAWAPCWALTARRPTAGAGGPTTKGWSWGAAGALAEARGLGDASAG